MRMFDVTILVVTATSSKRVEERIMRDDFHDACVSAIAYAVKHHGRILSIVEFKQPPRLVS